MRIALGICMVALAVESGWAAVDTIVINPAVKHQTIEGFGTFLDGTDQVTLNAWKDLGCNIMRMSMPKEVLTASPTDYATRVPLSPDLNADIAKMNFAIPSVAGFGANAQWLSANVRNFKLIADSWTAPHWMKGATGASVPYSGNPAGNSPSYPTPWLSNQHNAYVTTPSNTGDSIGGRLKTEDPTTLAEYGEYMASWVKGFQQTYGVKLANISLQNEAGFENPFDSMVLNVNAAGQYDPAQYAKALKSVRDVFAANGITTPIRGPHFANLGTTPTNPSGLFKQLDMINAVKNDSDPTLKNAMSIYTSNYYMGVDENSVKMTAAYWHGTASVANTTFAPWFSTPGVGGDGKENWFVETSDGPATWRNGTNGTVGNGAITVALKMHNALTQADASAYLYWRFVDGVGTPTEYGLLGAGQQANPTASKKYDAFGQFSKYIPAGSVRIDATFASNGQSSILGNSQYDTAEGLDVSAYDDEDDRRLTIILINATASAQCVAVSVPSSLGIGQLDMIRTSDSENMAYVGTVGLLGGAPTITVPAYSVMTLVGLEYAIVPEPSSLAWLGIGVMLLRRRAR